MALKLVFMGTPDFAVPTLDALIAAGHSICAAYTRAPRPAGRGLSPQPSPVAHLATRAHIPIETPANFKDAETCERLRAYEPDAIIVVAYGLLLPPSVLSLPRYGCLNLHASLLPRWRGAAPIQRAIMAGDSQTGVMVMRMEEGLDTGPVALTASMPLAPSDTASDLHDRLMARGAGLMREAVSRLQEGRLTFTAQSAEGVTYARKIEKAEARIDWRWNAEAVRRQIHALSPFPGAWTEMAGEQGLERIKILRCDVATESGTPGSILDDQLTIACGEHAIRPLIIQRAGRKAMEVERALNGLSLRPGTVLS